MKKSRISITLLWIVWLFWNFPETAGQTTPDTIQAPIPSGVDIRIEAMPKIATVGDPIRIDLDIIMPEGYHVEIPKPDAQTGDFTILDFFPGPTVPEAGTVQKITQAEIPQHHRARILAAIYKTGKFVFPSIRIELKTAEGKEVIVPSPPVNIEIQSVLTDKNPSLKDLKKQAEIEESGRWTLWLISALAGSILGLIAWRLWRRRSKRPVSLSPEQTRDLLDLAEAELKDLLSRRPPDSGKVKQFYVRLSEIIKRILESGYKINAAEQTTSEIMDSLRGSPALEPEYMDLIESFLLRCDVVKFAKYIPSTAEHESASRDALRILAEVRKAVADSRLSTVGN